MVKPWNAASSSTTDDPHSTAADAGTAAQPVARYIPPHRRGTQRSAFAADEVDELSEYQGHRRRPKSKPRYSWGPPESRPMQSRYRRTNNGILFDHIKPGLLYWHLAIHRYAAHHKPPHDSEGVIFYADGSFDVTKQRKWVVLERVDDQVTELPIYTFNDRGLDSQPVRHWHQYASIRPSHVTSATFKNQSPENPVLHVVDGPTLNGETQRETMVVYLPATRKHSIANLNVCLVSSITSESLETLRTLVGRYGDETGATLL